MAENEKLEQVEITGSETPDAPEAPVKKAEKKADKKPEKKSKPGFFARIKQWCKETKSELKKVQWPTWKQTLNNTLIVLVFCVVVGVCIFAFDKVADGLLGALINLFNS
jgi:preprotein translocase subunit SecE